MGREHTTPCKLQHCEKCQSMSFYSHILPCILKLLVESTDYKSMLNFACDQRHSHDEAASSAPQGNVTQFLGW